MVVGLPFATTRRSSIGADFKKLRRGLQTPLAGNYVRIYGIEADIRKVRCARLYQSGITYPSLLKGSKYSEYGQKKHLFRIDV